MHWKTMLAAGFLAKTCLAQAGVQLSGDFYLDAQLSEDETQAVLTFQMFETSAIDIYLPDGVDNWYIVNDFGGTAEDWYYDQTFDWSVDPSQDLALTSEDIGGGLWKLEMTRDLDTGDVDDYVIPVGSDWTISYSIITDSSTLSDADITDQTLTINLSADDGATHMAGLAFTSLAALALVLSH